MGITAVKSHAKGLKHVEKQEIHKKQANIGCYFLSKDKNDNLDNISTNLVAGTTSNLQDIRKPLILHFSDKLIHRIFCPCKGRIY